ncbi:MAG: peptidylprolyl isomerase, partial [Planctomycetota bacterium]
WLPLDGYDPNGDLLTYTATAANPAVVSTDIPLNNRSLKIDFKSWGSMTFELFDHLVPNLTNQMVDLATTGFFNPNATSGVKTVVDRVISSPTTTMIQMGTPSGGTSPVVAPRIDDEFDVRLQHTSAGLLTLIKPDGDDSGSSRFGILGAPARQLDFDNPIFGRLTEGDAARAGMNITTNTAGIPDREIQINSVSTFIDRENRLLMVRAPVGGSGSTNITVTVNDGAGNSVQQTFRVTVTPSSFNGSPFLAPMYNVGLGQNQTFTWNLRGGDAENDPTYYSATVQGPGTVNVDQQTGQLTYTPPLNFAGQVSLELIAQQDPLFVPTTDDPFDRQTVRLTYVNRVHAWSNDLKPTDVDGDNIVAPLDALLVINEVNQRQYSDSLGRLPAIRPDNLQPRRLFDVNDDGFVVPLDAIIVINQLNGSGGGEGEGTGAIAESSSGLWTMAVSTISTIPPQALTPSQLTSGLSSAPIQSPATALPLISPQALEARLLPVRSLTQTTSAADPRTGASAVNSAVQGIDDWCRELIEPERTAFSPW